MQLSTIGNELYCVPITVEEIRTYCEFYFNAVPFSALVIGMKVSRLSMFRAALMTLGFAICCRHKLLLFRCRSHPSIRQGTQSPGPRISHTFPCRPLPLRVQGLSGRFQSCGHGPHLIGLDGPNKAMDSTPTTTAICVTAVSGPTNSLAWVINSAVAASESCPLRFSADACPVSFSLLSLLSFCCVLFSVVAV